MYSRELEELIEAILVDGAISEKERSVLHRRAAAEGVDQEELDVIIEGRLLAKKNTPPPIQNSSLETSSTRISSKFGNIMKCPNCGEIVKPGTALCSICGLEFRNTEAVNSVEKFSDEIGKIDKKYSPISEDEKTGISPRAIAITSFIANFPIPNSKEDLLEFIVFTESKFLHLNNSTESDVAILRAYKAKYIESVEKAKIYFPDDSQFDPLFLRYEKNRKKKWREMNPTTRFLIIGACSLVAFMTFLFIMIFVGEANNW